MSQHLQDRELTDLLFDVAHAKVAAAAKKHLQGCKTCKTRQKQLRATIGQLKSNAPEFKASEDLIARTLRATRGEVEAPLATHEDELPPLDLLPRKSVLELSRFFWLAAAAAIVVAGVVTISTYNQGRKPEAVAMEKTPAAVSAPAPMSNAPRNANKEVALQKDSSRMLEVASVEKISRARTASAPAAGEDAEKSKLRIAMVDADRQESQIADGLRNERKRSDFVESAKQAPLAKAMVEKKADAPVIVAAAAPAPVMIAPVAAPVPAAMAAKTAGQVAMTQQPRLSSAREESGAKADAAAVAYAAVPVENELLADKMEKSAARGGAAAEAFRVARAETPEPAALKRGDARAKMVTTRSEVVPAGALGLANAAAPAKLAASDDDFEFTTQRVPFVLPLTSGTWILQQNVRVRASVTDSEARMDVSNHGVLPIVFQLMPRSGTNILLQFEINTGSASNFTYRTR